MVVDCGNGYRVYVRCETTGQTRYIDEFSSLNGGVPVIQLGLSDGIYTVIVQRITGSWGFDSSTSTLTNSINRGEWTRVVTADIDERDTSGASFCCCTISFSGDARVYIIDSDGKETFKYAVSGSINLYSLGLSDNEYTLKLVFAQNASDDGENLFVLGEIMYLTVGALDVAGLEINRVGRTINWDASGGLANVFIKYHYDVDWNNFYSRWGSFNLGDTYWWWFVDGHTEIALRITGATEYSYNNGVITRSIAEGYFNFTGNEYDSW